MLGSHILRMSPIHGLALTKTTRDKGRCRQTFKTYVDHEAKGGERILFTPSPQEWMGSYTYLKVHSHLNVKSMLSEKSRWHLRWHPMLNG
jgi:hypothetical protein